MQRKINNYRDDDLITFVFPHIMLEHGPEHGAPGTQYSLVALYTLPLTLDGDVSQGPRLQ